MRSAPLLFGNPETCSSSCAFFVFFGKQTERELDIGRPLRLPLHLLPRLGECAILSESAAALPFLEALPRARSPVRIIAVGRYGFAHKPFFNLHVSALESL